MKTFNLIFPDFSFEDFELDDEATILELKNQIIERKAGYELGNFKLMFRGLDLKDDQKVRKLIIGGTNKIEVHKQKVDPLAKFNL